MKRGNNRMTIRWIVALSGWIVAIAVTLDATMLNLVINPIHRDARLASVSTPGSQAVPTEWSIDRERAGDETVDLGRGREISEASESTSRSVPANRNAADTTEVAPVDKGGDIEDLGSNAAPSNPKPEGLEVWIAVWIDRDSPFEDRQEALEMILHYGRPSEAERGLLIAAMDSLANEPSLQVRGDLLLPVLRRGWPLFEPHREDMRILDELRTGQNEPAEQVSFQVGNAVLSILESGEHVQHRVAAARVLRRFGHNRQREMFALVRAAQADQRAIVRTSALESLGYLGTSNILGALDQIRLADSDQGVRDAAARAMRMIERRETQDRGEQE